jgi:hypothetical protein
VPQLIGVPAFPGPALSDPFSPRVERCPDREGNRGPEGGGDQGVVAGSDLGAGEEFAEPSVDIANASCQPRRGRFCCDVRRRCDSGDPQRTMALGHLVPAGSQDLGNLAGHPQEQGAFFHPFKESGRSRSRLPQATERRAKGEAKKLRGAPEGWKRCGVDRKASPEIGCGRVALRSRSHASSSMCPGRRGIIRDR